MGGAIVTSAALGTPIASAETAATCPARKRAIRLAHLTDAHVQPERGAGDGLAACLRHVQSLPDAPTLILQGGDAVMDACEVGLGRANQQADIWRRVWKAECSIPVEHCLGNHDIWAMDRGKAGAKGNEPEFSKQWGMDLFGLTTRYRTFDRAGWRFLVLDSTFIVGNGYTAKLDEDQARWLRAMLAQTDKGMPIVVLSHIPILSAAAFFDGDNEKSGDWRVPGAWMHIDSRQIKNLFAQHPNVKLCLSGHLHLADRVDYLGVAYVCNGAVCAGWWKGPNQECKEGYGLVDLYDDGTFETRYVDFGWKARA